MLASGNGEPMNCVSNLLKITRGECVYDRVKGIDPTILDKNSEIAMPLMEADAEWLIDTYEPRVDINSMGIRSLIAKEGGFMLKVDTTVTTE